MKIAVLVQILNLLACFFVPPALTQITSSGYTVYTDSSTDANAFHKGDSLYTPTDLSMQDTTQIYGELERWSKAFTVEWDTSFNDTTWVGVVNKEGVALIIDSVVVVTDTANVTIRLVQRKWAATSSARYAFTASTAIDQGSGKTRYKKITSFSYVTMSPNYQIGFILSGAISTEVSIIIDCSYIKQKKDLSVGGGS